jgi:tetratricopeptide (TPR) repeat protein
MMRTSFGRYTLLGELGAGGMGVVYRARDTMLEREVAVKVLPPEFAKDPRRRARFEQEARAVARLNHPNIMQVHDFGVDGEVAFAVVELVDGATLRTILGIRRLPWEEAVAIAVQVAWALAAAHAKGIAHRDLKPENVMVDDDGRVKVLDFGLAAVLGRGDVAENDAETESTELTGSGTIRGTPGYMAPEQVRGESCDARTDVFALGCLLYELVTGRRAFAGATPTESCGAVLRDHPPPPSGTVPELPRAFDRIIERCLAKRPADRFSTGHDVALALEAVSGAGAQRTTTGAQTPQRRPARRRWLLAAAACGVALAVTAGLLLREAAPPGDQAAPADAVGAAAALDPQLVLVIPFENQTGDKQLGPLGRMAADWIGQGLARMDGMRTVPALDVLGLVSGAGGTMGTRELAEATGAGVVVTGAYYRIGGALRFQATAVDAAAGEVLYTAEAAAGSEAPMLAIQELQASMVGAIGTRSGTLDPDTWRAVTPPNADAYREFLAGVDLFSDDYPRAIAHFDRSIELDPDFVTAYWYKAGALANQGRYAEAHAIYQHLGTQRERLTPFERHGVSAALARYQGRWDDAVAHHREQLRLAPRSTVTRYLLGMQLVFANRPREAAEVFGGFSGVPAAGWSAASPSCAWPFSYWGEAYHMLGRFEEELELARRGLETCGDRVLLHRLRLGALAGLGRAEELQRALDGARESQAGASSGGVLLRIAAAELRAHGDRRRGDELARRAVDWERENGDDAADLAWALRLAGEVDEAHRILREVLAGQADEEIDVELLGLLGVTAARAGDRGQAEEVVRRLGGIDRPYSRGITSYWQACVVAWLGEHERALAMLQRAFTEGQAAGVWLHRDPDLEPLWDHPEFQRLLEPRG